uniref:Uncharacterized protein n=1 Tax=Tanacetum cinerariifolium TaxID=118510 RepID=A0A6L2M5R6_TANCI|nr:hypothetical protein [Tanacetum cinerariifolium]
MMLYDALEKSMNRDHSKELAKDLAKAGKKKKKRRDSPKTPPGSPPHQPPPPPPLAGPSGASGSPGASGSSQTAASAEYQAWTMTDTRLRPYVSLTPADLQMDNDMAPDVQAQSSDDEDIENAHIPKTGDIAMFIDWFCKRQGITELKPQDLEGLAFELVKVFHPNVTIQYDFFFNKDLEYLRYDSKGGRPALSISKIKAAYYPDVGLEQMVPDQMWIEKECKYDIAAMYGIESYQTQLNLTKPRWDATGFEYKHDYMVIDSPRAITFQDRYGVQMIMCFNEIHKFSDGTLQQIGEALDYRVKEFKKRLKTRRIFCNLESFVGGQVRDGDYRLLKRTK